MLEHESLSDDPICHGNLLLSEIDTVSNTCNINKIVSLETWNYPAKTGQLLNIYLSHTLQSLGLLVYNERYGKFER